MSRPKERPAFRRWICAQCKQAIELWMTYDDAKNAHTLAKADELVHDDVGQSCDNLGEPVHFLPRDPKAVR